MANKSAPASTGNGSRARWMGGVAVSLFGLLLAQLAYRYLTDPAHLPLRVVEVRGSFAHLDRQRIREQVEHSIDGNFFTVDMARVRQAVLAMPWVAQVGVRRVWPDALSMQVTEQQALARWGDKALVNLHGQIFAPKPLPDSDSRLPRLVGDDSKASQIVDFYLRIHQQLIGSGLQVNTLVLNSLGEWQVDFDNGVQLLLGRHRVAQRFKEFLSVYPLLLAQEPRKPQRIDMRYEHGFAVRWQPQTATKDGNS